MSNGARRVRLKYRVSGWNPILGTELMGVQLIPLGDEKGGGADSLRMPREQLPEGIRSGSTVSLVLEVES